jgi:hypothetical protein
VLHLDVVLSAKKRTKHCIPFGTIHSRIQLYIGYGIQYLNARNDCLWKFTITTYFSSYQFFHPRREEFSPFTIVGPGTTNCVGYRKNFILSDFSSSHRRVVSNVWPGTTSYICYILVMSLGTHNHNPHPPTTQLPFSKCHSSIVGPDTTTNCVGYRQNFILSDFSSSHRRVVSNVWPGTTSYIHYFLVMSLGTHNHNPHPPTTQQLPSSKHHSSIVGPGTTNCVGYRQNFIL